MYSVDINQRPARLPIQKNPPRKNATPRSTPLKHRKHNQTNTQRHPTTRPHFLRSTRRRRRSSLRLRRRHNKPRLNSRDLLAQHRLCRPTRRQRRRVDPPDSRRHLARGESLGVEHESLHRRARARAGGCGGQRAVNDETVRSGADGVAVGCEGWIAWCES